MLSGKVEIIKGEQTATETFQRSKFSGNNSSQTSRWDLCSNPGKVTVKELIFCKVA